jgi:hypothetical protein
VWEGAHDVDGLEWYFSDSDSQSVANNEILFHGYFRPGIGGVFFPAEINGLPEESHPQVWVPAGTDLAEGYQWDWTGRWPLDNYASVVTLGFEAARDTIDVPYRDAVPTWKLSERPVGGPALTELEDGTQLDWMGRIVSLEQWKRSAEPDSTLPRWHALINSGPRRLCILYQDAFFTLVGLEDKDGGDIVPVAPSSFSEFKKRFTPR